jgi:hypothetical protein
LRMRTLATVLLFATIIYVAATAPAFAWNLHVPEGAKILYYAGGRSAEIALPVNFPLNVRPWYAEKMIIWAKYIEGGNSQKGVDIEIELYLRGMKAWAPWAHLYSDSTGLDWVKAMNKNLPPEDPENLKVIPNDVYVDRHGNSITISLKTAQTLKAGVPKIVYFTIPPFSLELEKVGGSFHREDISDFPYSGWTVYIDEMGFKANGAFTCTEWGYNNAPLFDCDVVMHGIRTYVPP